jgi:hypothetical protein
MCTAACARLAECILGTGTAAAHRCNDRGSTRCLICNRAWCNFCPRCSSPACVHLREGDSPCAVRRAVEEANMREYMRWIAATFPNELVRGSDTTFPDAVRRFKDRYPRDSREYGDTLNYFMLQAGQRYMRLGVAEFVEAIAIAVRVIDQIAGHADAEMHEYIQWIRHNRGHLRVDPGGDTAAAIILRFLADVQRDSPMYRGVFRSYLTNAAANHTEKTMDDFVRELRWAAPAPTPHSGTAPPRT